MSFLDNITAQLPFTKKSETPEYFFALNVGLSEVTAAVWELFGAKLDILGQAALAYEGTDDLVAKAHQVLDKALGALDIEPEKVLFGVPDSWSLDDNLKEPYLNLLKRMLKEYDLTPMAYVTTTNSIAHYLQKREGNPPTAIILGLGDFLEASLIRGGKLIETRSTKRSDQLFDDIEKVLRQFTDMEVLPSKVLLYQTKQNENLTKHKDDLMSYPWMQKLPLLHFPRIELLEDGLEVKAVTFAGAIELCPQIDLKHSFATIPQPSITQPLGVGTRSLPEEDLGFVKGDIKNQVEAEDLESDNLVSPDLEEDLSVEHSPLKLTRMPGSQPTFETNFEEPTDNVTPEWEEPAAEYQAVENQVSGRFAALAGIFNKIKLPKIPVKLPKNLRFIPGKILFVPVLLALLVAAYLFLFKASVTIFVEPKVLEKETQVVADPGATAVDEEKKVIPGSVVETTVTGNDKATATGAKQIGDPAKGKIVIYNLTSAKVSFSQGTVLVGKDNLKFSLDSSVQIASQSSSVGADFTTVIKPGKSDPVGVTASAIGPDSNLPAGSDLSAAGYTKSQVIARVEDALSGGTSKNVTVVTSDDQKKLQAKVLDTLRQKAETELQGKLEGGKKIISEGLSVADAKYTFTKQVNDQAGEFSLSASVKFKGTAYKEVDLRTIVSKLVETTVPDGFTLNLADSETQADIAKVEKDGKLIFKAKFKAKLLPKFDLEDIRKKIQGKSVAEVVDQLKAIDNIMGSEIKLIPSLPGPLARLPILGRNINIEITAK